MTGSVNGFLAAFGGNKISENLRAVGTRFSNAAPLTRQEFGSKIYPILTDDLRAARSDKGCP